jgi:hypothetical protein
MSYHPVRCLFCREPVDPAAPGTYRRVRGWVKVRARQAGAGGGSTALRMPEPPDAFAHGWCVARAGSGALHEQRELPL